MLANEIERNNFQADNTKWDAKFQCPNKVVGIVGQSIALNRDEDMEEAINNWITKAVQNKRLRAVNIEWILC